MIRYNINLLYNFSKEDGMSYRVLLVALLVGGCAQNKQEPQRMYAQLPEVPIRVDPMAQQMGREEVISATIQCEQSGLRAVPIMSKRIISGMASDIVVDIQCMPRRNIVEGKF
jgi:hypothetical protein